MLLVYYNKNESSGKKEMKQNALIVHMILTIATINLNIFTQTAYQMKENSITIILVQNI